MMWPMRRRNSGPLNSSAVSLMRMTRSQTASLIEGLGTHYDPHFNALAFATPIALSLRSRILSSLYPDGGQPRIDPARLLGAALGAVARVVQRASVEVFAAVRDAVADATLPELPASVAER